MNSTLATAVAEQATGHYPPATFLTPFSAMSIEERGRHFADRSNGHFFAVPDPDETRREKIDAILDHRFEFNGETHCVTSANDWLTNPSTDLEWHILLHKFYYAVGLGIAYEHTADTRYLSRWVALTSSWLETTPPGFIAADVTGRRVQNWIYAHTYFAQAIGSPHYPARVFDQVLSALETQVEYLCANLTPARNHRTLELYAIFLAGIAFPELAHAARWRDFAFQELVQNIQSDLLADGVQCELSTDYHHLVLKNYLCVRRLAQVNRIDVPAIMDRRLVQALEFSMFAHKPDGIVPSLSDGDARSFLPLLRDGAELFDRKDMLYVATQGRAGEPPRRNTHGFPASGYYVIRSGWGSPQRAYEHEQYLIFDCGPLGAGNHGHLDCLNFELAAFGRSLIVDPGRYTYSEAGEKNWRVHFRGTSGHNTVTVDGRNQTRYEPRVVKDATRHRPGSVRTRVTGASPDHELRTFFAANGCALLHGIAGSHEYAVKHERQIGFFFGEYWVLSDYLYGDAEHRFDSRLHLTERARDQVKTVNRWGTIAVRSPNLVVAYEDSNDIALTVDDDYVSYRYGEKHAAPVLRFTQQAASARFNAVLYPHDGTPPDISIREIVATPIDDPGRASACTLKIHSTTATRSFTDHILLADSSRAVWSFGKFTFSGKHLAIREDTSGEILALHADSGAWLAINGKRADWRGLSI